jgi:hypothetical protein
MHARHLEELSHPSRIHQPLELALDQRRFPRARLCQRLGSQPYTQASQEISLSFEGRGSRAARARSLQKRRKMDVSRQIDLAGTRQSTLLSVAPEGLKRVARRLAGSVVDKERGAAHSADHVADLPAKTRQGGRTFDDIGLSRSGGEPGRAVHERQPAVRIDPDAARV